MQRAVTDIRTELHSGLVDVRREIVESKTGLRTEFASFRAEMTELLQQHFAAIETWRVKLEGEMALLRWIVRVAVLSIVGIIIRLFVFRSP